MTREPDPDQRRPRPATRPEDFTHQQTLVRQDNPDDADPEVEAHDDPGTPGG